MQNRQNLKTPIRTKNIQNAEKLGVLKQRMQQFCQYCLLKFHQNSPINFYFILLTERQTKTQKNVEAEAKVHI